MVVENYNSDKKILYHMLTNILDNLELDKLNINQINMIRKFLIKFYNISDKNKNPNNSDIIIS